jgi:hypothetical protein
MKDLLFYASVAVLTWHALNVFVTPAGVFVP